jgi:hypothetical protein
MERSIPILLAAAVLSSTVQALPLSAEKTPHDRAISGWQSLSHQEMSDTTGEIAPIVAIAIGAAAGALLGATDSYVSQSVAGQEVDLGNVALSALGDAALGSLNAGAMITKKAVVIVSTVGLDVAYTAGKAAVTDFVGPPTPTAPKVIIRDLNVPAPIPTGAITALNLEVARSAAPPPINQLKGGGGAGEEHYMFF